MARLSKTGLLIRSVTFSLATGVAGYLFGGIGPRLYAFVIIALTCAIIVWHYLPDTESTRGGERVTPGGNGELGGATRESYRVSRTERDIGFVAIRPWRSDH
jgi:hypothetical protein